MLSTKVRKVATGSSRSAMANSGQLVPQTSVSVASSASTLGETFHGVGHGNGASGLVLVRGLEDSSR